MTVPGRAEACRLLLSLGPPDWFVRHSCAVADVAAWLANEVAATLRRDPSRCVAVAGLLHDVDKLLPSVATRGLPHGEGSAAWLTDRGYPELAPLVRHHPVTWLADPSWDQWFAAAPLEDKLVAYADKRAGQRLEPLDARFASWRRRYPARAGSEDAPTDAAWTDDVLTLVRRRAADLEAEVCRAAGVTPDGVRRLRWSRRALRTVRPIR